MRRGAVQVVARAGYDVLQRLGTESSRFPIFGRDACPVAEREGNRESA
jgi:hypothetical protein